MMDSMEKGGVVLSEICGSEGTKEPETSFPSIAIYSDTTAINWQVIDFPRNHPDFPFSRREENRKGREEKRRKKKRDICLMFYFVGKPSTCLLKNYN